MSLTRRVRGRCAHIAVTRPAVLLLTLATSAVAVGADFSTVINLSGNTISGGIGADTQLNIGLFGNIVSSVDQPFQIGPEDGTGFNTEVNFDGFALHGAWIFANAGSTLNINLGIFGPGFSDTSATALTANSGSRMNIAGGGFNNRVVARAGSIAEISGGVTAPSFFDELRLEAGSTAVISGGMFLGGFDAQAGSSLTLRGAGFRVNGVESTDLSSGIAAGGLLTGVLADGTVLIMSGDDMSGYPGRTYRVAAGAATLSEVSVAPADLTPFFTDSLTRQLRPGQTATTSAGTEIRSYFRALDAALDITADSTGVRYGATFAHSTVNATGTTIDPFFTAHHSATTLTGVDLGRNASFRGGSVTATNTTVGDFLTIANGSVAQFTSSTAGNVTIDTGATLILDDSGFANVGVFGGSTLHLRSGAVADAFVDGAGVVRVSGGVLSNLFVVAGSVEIAGGTVSALGMSSGVINIMGGSLSTLTFATDTTINLSGGAIGSTVSVLDSTVVNISGGNIVGDVTINGGVINLSGGQITGPVRNFGDLNITGLDFFLDGVAIEGLTAGSPLALLDRNATLTGTLADGSAFSFDLNTANISGQDFFPAFGGITLTLVPSPASALCFAIGGLAMFRRRR